MSKKAKRRNSQGGVLDSGYTGKSEGLKLDEGMIILYDFIFNN